jgi:hypothetical protein
MKKTTLLIIGALAFVLQASAQTTIGSQDFETQTVGNNPVDWNGNSMWAWVGGAATTTFDIENVLDSTGLDDTQAIVLGATPDGTSGWFGFSSAGNGTTLAPGGPLSDITCELDIESVSGGVTPTLWFCQNNNGGTGNQVWAASYVVPMAPDGTWTHVDINLDQLVIQHTGGSGNSEPFDPWVGFYFAVDGGASNLDPGTPNILTWDNITIVAVPEPGTIALITLGGLSALVAIRRRS